MAYDFAGFLESLGPEGAQQILDAEMAKERPFSLEPRPLTEEERVERARLDARLRGASFTEDSNAD